MSPTSVGSTPRISASGAPKCRSLRLRPDAPSADVSDVDLGVIITDSFSWPWRNRHCERGHRRCRLSGAGRLQRAGRLFQPDVVGYEIAVADEIAVGAGLVMGKLEQIPAALVRGLRLSASPGCATDLRRVAKGFISMIGGECP